MNIKTVIIGVICMFCIFMVVLQPVHAQYTYVTRAEAAMLLLSHHGSLVHKMTYQSEYPDVVEGQWYVPYVLYAVDQGMIDADPTYGLLQPHRPVTRAQFLKMMTIAYYLPRHRPHFFEDVTSEAWYAPYVGIAFEHNLFPSSIAPNLLSPEAYITHQEAAIAVQSIRNAHTRLAQVPQSIFRTSIRKVPVYHAQHESAPRKELSTASMVKKSLLGLFRNNSTASIEDTQLEVLDRINEERIVRGMQPLRSNEFLAKAAYVHAQDMHKRGYFSHFTPEGASFVDRIRDGGYFDATPANCLCQPKFVINRFTSLDGKQEEGFMEAVLTEECNCTPKFAVGENIAKGQLTPRQVVQEWMDSPPHRKNILRPEFEEIGMAIYGDYWVHNFGRIRFE